MDVATIRNPTAVVTLVLINLAPVPVTIRAEIRIDMRAVRAASSAISRATRKSAILAGGGRRRGHGTLEDVRNRSLDPTDALPKSLAVPRFLWAGFLENPGLVE
jgi:hypothetical protein